MILGFEDQSKPTSLQEFEPSSFEVTEAAFLNTWYDNPTVKGKQWLDVLLADQDPVKLTKEEATQKALEAKTQIKNIPEEGLSQEAFDILLERQQKAKERAEILDTADAGFFRQAIPALAAGFLDPLNIAADAGIAIGLGKLFKTGKFIAKGETLGQRTLRRGGLGAVEGTLGAAGVEPASYLLSQELGDDYDSFDSLQNIAFGTIFGAGLHMGAGALGDAIRRGVHPSEAGPVSPIGERIDAAPMHIKQEYAKVAVSNMLNDADVDVVGIRNKEVIEAHNKLEQIDAKLKELGNSKAFKRGKYKSKRSRIERLEIERAQVLKQLEMDVEKTASRIEIEAENKEVLNRKSLQENAADPTGKFDKKKITSELKRRIEQALRDGEKVTYTKDGQPKRILEVEGDKVVDADGKEISFKELTRSLTEDAEAKALKEGEVAIVRKKMPETARPIEGEISPEAPVKNSMFLDEEAIARNNERLKDVPDYDRMEVAEQMATDAEADLKEFAEQSGIDVTKDIDDANKIVKGAKEQSKLLKALARCASIKG